MKKLKPKENGTSGRRDREGESLHRFLKGYLAIKVTEVMWKLESNTGVSASLVNMELSA